MDVYLATAESVEGHYVDVFDARTGEQIKNVVRANSIEGWFERVALHADGSLRFRDGGLIVERVVTPIRMALRSSAPASAIEAYRYANAMLTDGR